MPTSGMTPSLHHRADAPIRVYAMSEFNGERSRGRAAGTERLSMARRCESRKRMESELCRGREAGQDPRTSACEGHRAAREKKSYGIREEGTDAGARLNGRASRAFSGSELNCCREAPGRPPSLSLSTLQHIYLPPPIASIARSFPIHLRLAEPLANPLHP